MENGKIYTLINGVLTINRNIVEIKENDDFDV